MNPLPPEVRSLFKARDKLRQSLTATQKDRLPFAFDGNLVGDLGEWIAMSDYAMVLAPVGQAGVDGKIDGKTVQVKATITGKQAAFRYLPREKLAERLLVFKISENGVGYAVLYDGPQWPVVATIYERWKNSPETQSRQRSVTANQLRMHQDQILKAA